LLIFVDSGLSGFVTWTKEVAHEPECISRLCCRKLTRADILFVSRVATESQLEEKPLTTALERRWLLDELVSKGVRITAQRRAIVEVIQEAKEHLDATTLLKLARQREPNVDRATIYRTIELLKELRLVDELDLMHLEGEKHYYEVKTTKDHIHLACFRCGRIEEFASPLFERLKAEISKQSGFNIRVTRLEVGGSCRACTADEGVAGQGERAAETEMPVDG
jgi:Fur family ferric uptake transcriptional regulator